MSRVLVVGAGWSGATVARRLADAGLSVEVLERAPVVGGHSRAEVLCGVVYEPNGPHILHTERPDVADWLAELGLTANPYSFRPMTEIDTEDGPRCLSWPIQVGELESLPEWPRIKVELDAIPDQPSGADFESYAISLMGETLYRLFIEGYTRKQWGCEPSSMSSSFAPKRIDLRRDGDLRLFRTGYQWFPAEKVNDAIGTLLHDCAVTAGADVSCSELECSDVDAIVVTAALDTFAGAPDALAWRGVHLRSRYYPCSYPESSGVITAAHVINRPSMSVPFTRTIETKHATGQTVRGTVVSYEYPGAPAKHYPVADLYGKNARTNDYLQAEIRERLAPVPTFFCGRLATYRYINQDDAIADAWACADDVLASIEKRRIA